MADNPSYSEGLVGTKRLVLLSICLLEHAGAVVGRLHLAQRMRASAPSPPVFLQWAHASGILPQGQ